MAAAAVLAPAGGAGAADQLHVEVLERLAQERRIGVPRQHDVGWAIGRLDERQQHELAVPHGDDAGMVLDVSATISSISSTFEEVRRTKRM